ncbi:hypothetical protein [Arthrobacter sp. AOP36-C1-22]
MALYLEGRERRAAPDRLEPAPRPDAAAATVPGTWTAPIEQ